MRKQLLEMFRQRPFRPFRILFVGGDEHTILQPNQAMIVGTLAFVGVLRPHAREREYADVAIVSISQITAIEPLA